LHHVSDGAQAVEFLRNALGSDEQSLPQTVFLDLKMPVLNGFEVLDWMRTQTFPATIQVIVLSGSEHPNDKDRAARLGAMDYLVKPVKVTDLHRLLQDVCPQEMGARV
jgi:CheY-like chemotaxis protein